MASMAGSHLCNSISRKAQPRQLEQLFKLAYSGSPSSMAISHCRCEHLAGGSRRHSCRRFETDVAGTASAHSLAPASTTVVAWHLHSLGDTTAFHGCLPAAAFGCSPVDAFVCLSAATFVCLAADAFGCLIAFGCLPLAAFGCLPFAAFARAATSLAGGWLRASSSTVSIAETNSSHCTDSTQVSTHNGTAQTMQQQQQQQQC